MTTEYFVEIVETSTGKLAGKISAGYSLKSAQRVESGVMINMDHERYHTEIVTYNEKKKD